jgi:streptomycin 6-kinase
MTRGLRGPIPARLDWLKASARGRAWLDALPQAVDESSAHWRLKLEEPFPDSFTSLAIPGLTDDGADVVLKLQYIDRETEHEAEALRAWAGDGAILLLDRFADRDALLLERCIPGTPVPSSEGVDVLIGLLPRLWKPATSPPFRTLREEAAHWHAELTKRPRSRLVDAALDALGNLPSTQGEPVLLHQDLHGWNVLAAEREPWLVIDPKPLVGEKEFGLAPIIRSTELGEGKRETIRRLDRLTSELGLDRERARLWCIAQTVAWSEPEARSAVAEWLLDA